MFLLAGSNTTRLLCVCFAAGRGYRGPAQPAGVDMERERYTLLIAGRQHPLGVKLDSCRLESVVEREGGKTAA